MSPLPPTLNIVRNVISLYRTPLIEVSTKCVFTNTTLRQPLSRRRPAGGQLLHGAADRLRRRRDRHRPHRAAPPQPDPPKRDSLQAAAGTTYDSGDFPAMLKQALELADWKGFAKRKRESKKRGKLRGIGIGCYLEVTAPANKEMGGIRFEADGSVTILTGTLDYGQGHAAPFAQVLSEKLGMPFDKITPAAGRQRPAARRRRHRRLALDDELRHGDRRSRRQGDRAGQADRLARARSLGRRHRVRGRPLHHRRHRPRDRHHGAGRQAAHRHEAAAGRAAVARRQPRQRRRAVGLSRTAATSARSRSIPTPATSRS